MLFRPTMSILAGLPLALIQLVLFVPPFLFHLPGYATGPLLAKCLAVPGEEESPAQFKAVGGGLGIGATMALALGVLWKRDKLGTSTTLLGLNEDDTTLKRILGLFGSVYLGVLVLVKWHKLLVKGMSLWFFCRWVLLTDYTFHLLHTPTS
jgi:glycerol-3-phosphate O-acyltransferase/dihydroxyacetone phosphate acyltransferase